MTDLNNHYNIGLAVAAYDLFAGGGMLTGDIEFYLDCATRFGDPVLEIGVGTGRVLLPLINAGYEVVGLDLSSKMLKVAAEKMLAHPEAATRAHLIEADMTNFDLGRQFSLVMITARSFQHVVTPKEQRSTLSCVRRHMTIGDHLVLDLFDPSFEVLFGENTKTLPVRTAHDPGSGQKIRRSRVSIDVDPQRQTVRETLLFEAIDERDKVVAKEEASWTLRWSSRQEIAYLLELTGFEVVDEFSDFSCSAPAYAREQLWIARAT
ncbi:MAG: class I SAM-dependent methyltransferase [Alphaproteobacteria bacterium GM202ARS2]|nr:class I SAM-dependent methyltransferase [Alphaproteobacteria bacterium GM202ARS2]